MNLLSLVASVSLTLVPAIALAQAVPAHTPHAYTTYEKLVLKNASQFHKNFDAHEWDKNGPLVADDLHVNSNGAELHLVATSS